MNNGLMIMKIIFALLLLFCCCNGLTGLGEFFALSSCYDLKQFLI